MNDASNPRSSGGGRPAVDLDELERQLRQMAAARPSPAGDAVNDLSRIIDRSDPVRAALRGTLADERSVPPQQRAFEPAQPVPQEQPAHQAPAYQQPVYHAPISQQSAYEEPAPQEPAPQEPFREPPPLRPSLDAERQALVRAAQEDAVAALERAFAKELLAPASAQPAPSVAPAAASMLPAREALEAFLRREPAAPAAPAVSTLPLPNAWPEAAMTGVQPVPQYPAAAEQAGHDPRFVLPEPEPEPYGSPLPGDAYTPAPAPALAPEQDMRPLTRRRGGKGVAIAASMLGVGVLGLLLAFAFRSDEPSAPSGQPPVVRAEDSPARVAPANPGGLVIPNQNKQIYEPSQSAAPGSSNVVTTTEQPVDLNQVVRSQPSRVVLPGPGGADNATGAAGTEGQAQPANPVNQLLGEPRRVKTVAVRPDGTIIAADSPASLPTSAPSAAVPVPAPRPAAPATSGATPAPAEPARAPGTTGGNLAALATAASAPLAISPGAADAEKNQQRITAPAPAPRTLPPVAQAAPAQPAPAAPPARVAAAPATAPAPSGGGFTVQLAAPGSEQEARSTFAALQRRFPDLGGYQPIVRRAEVGNRTLYRLRVGPMDRPGAVALCERLKASGGQCFVAANN